MQNQNAQSWSWSQGTTTSAAASSSSFPHGSSTFPNQFPSSNVDPSNLISSYQQLYGAAAAGAASQGGTDYDPSQWSTAQMQQWQQWQQWQEKFQEWQSQYGKKYAETMAAMGQSPNITMPGVPPGVNLLPKNAAPVPNPGYTTANPPLPSTNQPAPPPPPEEEKPPPPSAPIAIEKEKPPSEPKDDPEELSEAEKTFDEQFKQWEGKFNEWKKQNEDHPDKTQYREYEKKWEQWREQLLQRREQMRKKRLSKTINSNDSEPTAAAQPVLEEVKIKLPADQGTAQSKPLDPDYSYSTQASQPSFQMASYSTAPPKFDISKPPPFGNQQGNQGIGDAQRNQDNFFNQGINDAQRNQNNFFNQRPPPLLIQDGPKNMDFNRPPGNFGNWGKDNNDFNRPGPFNKFQDNQNFNRDPGFFGNQSPNFDENNERNFNQGPNDGNFNKKFRGQNFDNRFFGSDSDQGRFGGPNFIRNNDFPPNRFENDNFDEDFNDNFNRGPSKFGGNNRDSGINDEGPNFGRNQFNNPGPRGKFDLQGPNSRFNDQNFNQGHTNERNYNNEMKSLFDTPINPPGGGLSLLGKPSGPASLLGNSPGLSLLNNPPSGPPSLLNNPSNSLLGNSPAKSLLGNAPSNPLLGNAPPKNKVPSLFDITFDKPPALMSESSEKKPWEKYEKDDYYDDPFEDKQENEDESSGPWPNSNNNFNNNKGKFNNPWTKPWEGNRPNVDKNTGPRSDPWQKGPKSGSWEEGPRQGPWEQGNRPWQENQDSGRGPLGKANSWINDNNASKDLEKAELSGYVGNILAKLGNINANNMPPNFAGRNEEFVQDNSRRPNFPNRGDENDGNRFRNDNDGNRFRNDMKGNNFGRGGNNRNQRNFNKRFFNENDNSQNTPSPRENFQDMNSPRDNFRQNEQNRNYRNQNRLGPNLGPANSDQVDESSRSSIGPENPVNFGGPPNRNTGTDFTDDVNLSDENFHTQERFPQDKLEENELFNASGDIDDRNQYENEPSNLDKDDGNFQGRDDREQFIREDSRGSFGKEEQGNFGNNERDGGDKKFGRDNRNFRGGRNRGRRGGGFDRDDRDDRLMRGYDRDDRRGLGPYDRYVRGRDYPPEPEWNPQVFDYSSQTRTNRYLDPEDIFKYSTVVDYSHGQPENKQTFDYGHGGKGTDKAEDKNFDFKFGAAAPEVIDYGHGSVNKEPDAVPDWKKEQEKEVEVINEVKIEPKVVEPIRERSRSPPPPPFRLNTPSPPFRGRRPRSRDRFGRPILKRNNRKEDAAEMKLQTGDKENSKNSFDVTTVLVEDLICAPGRSTRPNKLVFIMRGLPGSGKTYVTKLIKDKEIEMGGDAPRILSLDDYFMTEVEKEETDPETGRKSKTKILEYEYESAVEPHYRGSLLKAFKKTISDGFFSFVIIDSVNEKTKDYEEMWSFAKQKGFQVYVAEMDDDVTVCTKRNVHKRTEKEIQDLARVWEKSPSHYIRLDVRSLLQAAAITEVEMEVVSDTEIEKIDEEEEKKDENKKEDEEEDDQGVTTFVKSRWDNFENSEQKLARLDGLMRRKEGFHTTMEDYLQLPDDVGQQPDAPTGKKRVRWADLEERRQQEKMRAIGFVVGQTDWQRMTDPTFGESALTRTKYI